MTCCKIYLMLSALVTCHASADYEYERLKALSQISPVFWNSRYDNYETASSEILPRYYDSYESSEDRSTSNFERPSEHIPVGGIKKKLSEDKNLKKRTSPFYASLANKDSVKRKELVPNSGVAHCQEIRGKSIAGEDEPRKGVTTCYRCKDPKTKSTYERCLYNSQPEESASAGASTRTERFLPAPASLRHRRSSSGEIEGHYRNPYRFDDKYFTDATDDVPATYEKKGEKCEKIVKDSMVCMVCKDAKTNGKYEQCSYVKQPRDEAYSYTKSSSFGKPEKQSSESAPRYEGSSSEPNRRDGRDPTTVEEQPRQHFYFSEVYPERTSAIENKEEEKDASSTNCKQVQKDSKTCTVCKDPKIGGTYEKCSYNYQPSDKLYKYSRSKSFGYPDKTSDTTQDKIIQASDKSESLDYPRAFDSTHHDDYFDKSEASTHPRRSEKAQVEAASDSDDSDDTWRDRPGYSSEYSNPEESSDYGFTSDSHDPESHEGQAKSSSNREKSASEHHSENINADHCKKIQKDSMICTVCKDPTTGNDFEQCSYSYQPRDKLFSYTKSSSFDNSKNNNGSQRVPRENERSDSSEIAEERDSYDYVPGQTYEASTANETRSEDEAEGKARKDIGYSQTTKKKAEIEGFLQNFQKEDRSKCKKIMRDKMTCYQCIDENGFQKEECVFVTGQKPDKDQLAFREIKEFQVSPASSSARARKLRSSRKTKADRLEPDVSASKNSYVRLEKPDNDYPDEAPQTTEETKEAEPYDSTSETRSRYDKVLGFTLPAYMFTTSEHEAAFDEVVASSYD